jgi:hypothetical protein
VDILWQRFGGDPLQGRLDTLLALVANQTGSILEEATNVLTITRQAYTNGVIQITSRAGDITEKQVLELIQGARSNIDLCGYTLYYLFERQGLAAALEERAHSGVAIRVCVCGSANPDVFQNVRPETVIGMKGLMTFVLSSLSAMGKRLNGPQQTKFEPRKLDKGHLPLSMMRFDDKLSVVWYLWTKYTSETPAVLLQGADKPLFQTYLQEFQHYFDVATPI